MVLSVEPGSDVGQLQGLTIVLVGLVGETALVHHLPEGMVEGGIRPLRHFLLQQALGIVQLAGQQVDSRQSSLGARLILDFLSRVSMG